MVRVGGEVGHALEEGPPGDGGEVDVVEDNLPQRALGVDVEVLREGVAEGQVEGLVGDVIPAHEGDELLSVLGEVLGVDGEAIPWIALKSDPVPLGYVKGDEADILPVGFRRESDVVGQGGGPAVGDGEK